MSGGPLEGLSIVDLSMPIDEQTPYYPGDPTPRVCPASTIARDGFNVSRVDIGSHTGTHCDAPYHFLEDGVRLDELPLTRFCGPAVVVDASGRPPRTPITPADVEPYLPLLGPHVIVLLRTGWSAHRDASLIFAHPFLDREACARILETGVRTVGIDAMSLDQTPEGAAGRDAFPCHELVSRAEGVIVENLMNLDRLGREHPFVSFFPIHLRHSDGAPVRAVAIAFPPGAGPPLR